MNNYRNISTSFWSDSKVDDEFTPEDKYFYLYLLTNPHTNICGCYEISSKQMERETGYNTDTCNRLIDRMERIHNILRYSKETKEVLLLNWAKYNWTKSEKLVKAVTSVASYIKNPKFKAYILNKIQNTDTVTDTDTDVSIPYAYGIDTVSAEAQTSLSEKPKSSRFIPPTVSDVRAYCLETKRPINADAFINYYQSNGWKVGRNPMKDWKAAVRNWYQRDNGNKAQSRETSYDMGEVEAKALEKYKNL